MIAVHLSPDRGIGKHSSAPLRNLSLGQGRAPFGQFSRNLNGGWNNLNSEVNKSKE